jgi:dipeptidyl aminopeptidase/acylaminoacyl peptidase
MTWKGVDGATIEGLLNSPVDYVPGQKYPLIVMTHGGPAASDKFGFATEIQFYASKGYAVLGSNHRGSTGYGDKFLRDMVNGYSSRRISTFWQALTRSSRWASPIPPGS